MKRSAGLAFLLLLGCHKPSQPDAGTIPPKVAHVLVLSGTRRLTPRVPSLVDHWSKTAGFPNALVLANGLPEETKEVLPALSQSLAALNLAGFTLGRREVSMGSDALDSVRTKTNAQWLAANVETSWPGATTVSTFERNRLPIAVIGLSDLAGVDGFTERPLEGVLSSTLAQASRAPVVVVLLQGCSTEVKKLVAAHAEWKIDLLVAAPCEGTTNERIGATMLVHPSAEEFVDLRAEVGQVRSLAVSVPRLPSGH